MRKDVIAEHSSKVVLCPECQGDKNVVQHSYGRPTVQCSYCRGEGTVVETVVHSVNAGVVTKWGHAGGGPMLCYPVDGERSDNQRYSVFKEAL